MEECPGSGRLVFPTGFVAFGLLEPLQDRHHGAVTAAGTPRERDRVVEPLRGLCVLVWRRELRLLGSGLAGATAWDTVNPVS